MRRVLPLALIALASVALWATERVLAPGGMLRGEASASGQPAARAEPAHRFQQVAEGVYSAIGTGTMNVGSNSAVIVNDEDVLIVDSHITPASARVLLEGIETLTDKPVRYVVNTHYHFDHAHGNQVFPPGVEIIGHEFTREKLLGDVLRERTYRSFTDPLPQQAAELEQQAAGATDPARRAELARRLAVLQDYRQALQEVRPTPPNLTLRTRLTLYRGGREIQMHFFGRGHTGGDVVVYLPQERVVCTGDLLVAGLAYMGDAYVPEWIETLDALRALDFETIIPGHGEPFSGKERIARFQAYLKDAWDQVSKLHAAGLPAEEAARRVDLTRHREFYPQIQGPGLDLRAVLRMYEVMGGP